MRRFGLCVAVAVTALGGCANDQVAFAPGLGSDSDRDQFVARIPASGPNCPEIDLNIRRLAGNSLSGVMFRPTEPGVVSSLTGQVAPDGGVSISVTPLSARSSPGTLVGTMRGPVLTVSMVGGTCPMNNIQMTATGR